MSEVQPGAEPPGADGQHRVAIAVALIGLAGVIGAALIPVLFAGGGALPLPGGPSSPAGAEASSSPPGDARGPTADDEAGQDGGESRYRREFGREPLVLAYTPSNGCDVSGVDFDTPSTNTRLDLTNEIRYWTCGDFLLEFHGRNFGEAPGDEPASGEDCAQSAALLPVGDRNPWDLRPGEAFCVITDRENVTWIRFVKSVDRGLDHPDLHFEFTLWRRA